MAASIGNVRLSEARRRACFVMAATPALLGHKQREQGSPACCARQQAGERPTALGNDKFDQDVANFRTIFKPQSANNASSRSVCLRDFSISVHPQSRASIRVRT